MTTLLNDLTSPHVKFQGNPEADAAFGKHRECSMSAPILYLPDPQLPFHCAYGYQPPLFPEMGPFDSSPDSPLSSDLGWGLVTPPPRPKVSISKVVNPVVIWLRLRDDEDSLQLPCGLSKSSPLVPASRPPLPPGLLMGDLPTPSSSC